MALKIELLPKTELEAKVSELRANLKALEPRDRVGSKELEEFTAIEKVLNQNLYGLYGIKFTEAYAKLESVTFDTEGAHIFVRIFINADARHAGEESIRRVTLKAPMPDSMPSNPFAWAYGVIKEQTGFEQSEDV